MYTLHHRYGMGMIGMDMSGSMGHHMMYTGFGGPSEILEKYKNITIIDDAIRLRS